jgi:hypothetical protein
LQQKTTASVTKQLTDINVENSPISKAPRRAQVFFDLQRTIIVKVWKLLQESDIILGKLANVRDTMNHHGKAFHAKARCKT